MKILIIGSGGREHALGWKLKQSPLVGELFFAPGNGGTSELGKNIDIKAHEINELLSFAIENKIDLTIVGPEDPLSLGIVDLFERRKQVIFGPSQLASRLESSKAWSTWFMKKYSIPQPVSHTFKEYKKVLAFIVSHDMSKYVIKASGLALGKGVVLPSSEKEAKETIERMMIRREFGNAGKEVVIQERLAGSEVSLMALSDGKNIRPLISAQDHKRIYNNDKGPNTGGMGAYAPVPFVTKKLIKQIQETILEPTIKGMKKEKCPYKGVLYVGLMITKEGPKVLEYNVRFGDPETQSVLMLLRSDLLSLLVSSIQETLKSKRIVFYRQAAVCVMLASHGYPGSYNKGELIEGLTKKKMNYSQIFHGGTAIEGGDVITNGGRVLSVCAMGGNIKYAIRKAYNLIGRKGIYFKDMQYRTDIGNKVIITINKKNHD